MNEIDAQIHARCSTAPLPTRDSLPERPTLVLPGRVLDCDRRPLAQHRETAPQASQPAKPGDAETVIYRLEEAGSTLLALPDTGYSTKLRSSALDIVRTALENYGWAEQRIRPAIPSAARITRMDEAMGWIGLIPDSRYVLRRIVGARSLVSPVTERHLFSWRRLGAVMGADHKAVQRWHAQGIDLIVAALN